MLDGRVAIVTGASRGIGAAGARALGAAGASVVLAARDSAALAQVAAEISQAGGPEVEAQAARAIPVGRMGTPAEVARAVVWLASDESAFVTGTTLTADGGLLAGRPTFGP